jgi:hypothetical protein
MEKALKKFHGDVLDKRTWIGKDRALVPISIKKKSMEERLFEGLA